MSDKCVTSSNTKSIPPSKTSWVDNVDNIDDDNDLPPLPDGWLKDIKQDTKQDCNGFPWTKVTHKKNDKSKQEKSQPKPKRDW